MIPLDRRTFLKTSALATAAAALPKLSLADTRSPNMAPINIFSKHLQFLDYSEMAKIAKEIGFDGIDLTVRPDGHVEPGSVKSQLPRAVGAIRDAGLESAMITTAVDDANDPVDRSTLNEAAKLGIKYYRMNWFPYPKNTAMPAAIERYRKNVEALGSLNENLDLVGCYQNHAGLLVGASLWEVWQILANADSDHFGVQYDIRHATVEGGLSWPNGFQLIQNRIKTIVLKDFKWTKNGSRTEIVNTPIGEGMVDFDQYFKLLKKAKINVPISLHLEYDIGGAQWGKRELTVSRDTVYEAMSKDLQTIKRLWSIA